MVSFTSTNSSQYDVGCIEKRKKNGCKKAHVKKIVSDVKEHGGPCITGADVKGLLVNAKQKPKKIWF